MVSPADNEVIGSAFAGLQPNIMVGIERIPVQRVRQGIARNRKRHRVGSVRRHLGMKCEPIHDRRIGGHNGSPGGNRATIGYRDHGPVVPLLDLLDDGLRMKCPAFCGNHRGETLQIFERMKGGLTRISQHMLLVAMGQRHTDQPMHGRADRADGVQFLLDDFRIGVQRLEEIAVEPAKIAVDLFTLLNLLDAIDGRGLALIEGAGDFLSAQFDHFRGQIIA